MTRDEDVGGMPIGRLMSGSLITLVLIATLPVLVLGYLAAHDNTSRLLRDRIELQLDDIVHRVSSHLQPVREQLAYAQEFIARSTPAGVPLEQQRLDDFLLGTLAAAPQMTGIGLIAPDGTLRAYRRAGMNLIEEPAGRVANGARTLARARANPAVQWLDVAWSPILKEPVIRVMVAVNDAAGTFRGALVGAVATSTLSRYLKSLTQRGSPVAFILTGRDRVLAYPGMADGLPVPTKADGAALPLITDIDDAVLAALWSDDRRELSALAELRQSRGHWTWVAGSSFGYFYRTLRGYGDEPWTVGIYLPGVETRRERWLVRGIAIGGALLLGVAASLAMLIGRRLGRPVLQLASIAERIERLDFESARDLPRGPIKEVNQAICAFERTAVGLSLFQSYVPRPVARLLLERHGNLQPEEMTGTVLFVDIVGFTSLAEALPPRQVVALLNEYFTAMSEIISANNGVITQFQGDAVLATFNIPLRLSGHATAAVRSALQILSMVSQRLFSGQSVHVRIGINTGRLTGGSVGAAGRLSYTVHGDAVNLAARLEQMNKEYGTVMLVSESTVALIGTLDCLRRIGPVNVRGRSRPVDIYALVPTPDLRSALHQTDCIVAAS